MSESKVKLTEKQIDNALAAFARGSTTSQVIDDLIFDFEDLEDDIETRAMLRDQLRSVNPNDKRFSQSKYGIRFEMVHATVIEELQRESREAMRAVISSITSGIDDLGDIGKSLSSMLDNASDFDITSNTEYLNTIRTLASLQKVRVEGVNALSNLVAQLCKLHALGSADTEGD